MNKNGFNNAQEEWAASLQQFKEEYEQANPGCSWDDYLRSDEFKAEMKDSLRCSAWAETTSINELVVMLRVDYEAAAQQEEIGVTLRMEAIVRELVVRHQTDRLLEEYKDNESFVGYIASKRDEVAFCFRLMNELVEENRMK